MKYDIFRRSKRFDSSWKNLDQIANPDDQEEDEERLRLPEHFLKKPVLHQKNLSMFNDIDQRKRGAMSPKRKIQTNKSQLPTSLYSSMDCSKVGLKSSLSRPLNTIAHRDQSNSMISIKERKSSENTNSTKGHETAKGGRRESSLHRMNIKENLLNPPSASNLDEHFVEDIRRYNEYRRRA